MRQPSLARRHHRRRSRRPGRRRARRCPSLTPLVFEAGAPRRRRRPAVGARAHVLAVEVQRRHRRGGPAGAARLDDARRRRVSRPAASSSSSTSSRWPRCPSSRRTFACNTRVVRVAGQHHDRMKDAGRRGAPFLVRVSGPDGEQDVLARAVIDASGTIDTPGAARRVGRAGDRRARGARPDLLRHSRRPGRSSAPGTRAGACSSSAAGTRRSTRCSISRSSPRRDMATRITWAIRRPTIGPAAGGRAEGSAGGARASSGRACAVCSTAGALELVTGFHIDARDGRPRRASSCSAATRSLAPVDEIIAATGFRPDWSILSEVPARPRPGGRESARARAAHRPQRAQLRHRPPHGAEELKQPDAQSVRRSA